jgi:hypothetical protein
MNGRVKKERCDSCRSGNRGSEAFVDLKGAARVRFGSGLGLLFSAGKGGGLGMCVAPPSSTAINCAETPLHSSLESKSSGQIY